MKVSFLFFAYTLVAATLPSWGQKAVLPSVMPVADTTGYEKRKLGTVSDRFYWGTLRKVDGTEIHAFLPTRYPGYEVVIDYFSTPPANGEWNSRQSLKIDKCVSMEVRGRVYETVQHKNKNTKIMALRVVEGPVSLFTYVEARQIFLPIPLGVGLATPLLGIPISGKNHWYVRRKGVWTEIPRSQFSRVMMSYLSDAPDLAAKVGNSTSGYLYNDMIYIVNEYNKIESGISH